MKITPVIISQVLINLPDLSSNGFRFRDRGKFVPATDEEFKEMRSDLFEDFRIEEIQTACEYIQSNPIGLQEPVDSYALKHRAERWGRTFDKAGYVCNGAVIIAAILCGYTILREKNSPNCRFSRKANTTAMPQPSTVGS